MGGLYYGIAGPPRYRRSHENSPKKRYAWVNSGGRAAKAAAGFLQRPPYSAVRALLFSMGYATTGFTQYERAKWDVGRKTEWVPFQVTKAGVVHTRWVRSIPGEKMQVNDGSLVPRRVVIAYAAVRFKQMSSATP